LDTTGEEENRTPRKTWMEGVQVAMTTRNLEPDQWETERNVVWFPEDGDSCLKTGHRDRFNYQNF